MKLDGATSVITGGANGIGRAVALELARLHGRVVIADMDDTALAETARAIEAAGGEALTAPCDVTLDEDVARLAAATLARFGPPAFVLANAGRAMGGIFERIEIADWRRLYDVNVFGVVRTVRAFLPHVPAGGRIAITASSIALAPGDGFSAPYGSSKAALVQLAQQLQLYLKRREIGVTLLVPALTNTRFARTPEVIGIPAPPPDEARIAASDTPEHVATLLLDGLRADRFLVAAPIAGNALHARRVRDLEETTEMMFGRP